MAVMCDGQVEQVGTQKSYIKSLLTISPHLLPRQTLFRLVVGGRVWETEIGCFALGSDLDSYNQTELMIRQEDLMIHPDDAADVIIRAHQF